MCSFPISFSAGLCFHSPFWSFQMFENGAIAEIECLAGSKLVKLSVEMLVEHKGSEIAKDMKKC